MASTGRSKSPVRKTKKELAAEAKHYYETVDKTPVYFRDMKPGMIIVRPNGARYEVDSVNVDSEHGTFARRQQEWKDAGLVVKGAMCYFCTRIDDWDLPGADLERLSGSVFHIARPDVSDFPVMVETNTIH